MVWGWNEGRLVVQLGIEELSLELFDTQLQLIDFPAYSRFQPRAIVMKTLPYLSACGNVLGSSTPRCVHSASLRRQALQGWPLSHLILLALHQSQARETCFRVRLTGDGGSAAATGRGSGSEGSRLFVMLHIFCNYIIGFLV